MVDIEIAYNYCYQTFKGQLDADPEKLLLYKEIVRKKSITSLYFFSKFVLENKLLTKQTHKRWADNLQVDLETKQRIMRLKPRGTYKTTLYGISLILWLWVAYGSDMRIFYTSANSLLLGEISDTLRRSLERGSFFRFIFPEIERDKTSTNTNEIFNLINRGSAKGYSLVLRTAGSSVNGVHPNFIIVDDPCDKEDRDSNAVRIAKTRWFDSLTPLLVPYQKDSKQIERLLFIATRWHMNDLMQYVFEKNDRMVDSDKWSIEIESVLTGSEPTYPEFFSLEKIDAKKREIDPVFFSCQYLNTPLAEGTQLFNLDQLHFYDHSVFDGSQGINYCFLDPSQGKRLGDYPANIFVNRTNNKLYIFYAIDKKIELAKLLELIAVKNKEFNIPFMYYEDNGSNLINKTLVDLHKAISHTIRIIPIRNTKNKIDRINSMQPQIVNGQVLFRQDYERCYPELMRQLEYFPVYQHDDYPDVIEMAVNQLLKQRPVVSPRVTTINL